jgi:hypothetical protein
MLEWPSFTSTFISLGIDIPVDESNLPPGGITQGRCRKGSSTPWSNMTLWPRLVPPSATFERAQQPNRPSRTGSRRSRQRLVRSHWGQGGPDLRRRHFLTLCLGDECRQRLCPAPHRLAHETQPVCAFQCLAGFEQAVYYQACHIGQRCALVHLDILALAEAK